jgi:hypothetical protein
MGFPKLIRHGFRMLVPFADRISVRAWTGATVAFIAIAAVVAFATCSYYGITWDEEHSMEQGRLLLRWYTTGFTDRNVIDGGNYWFYGGLFNVLAQVSHRATGFGLYETSHVINVVFGLAGVALAAWIATSLFNPMAGFLAAVFLWMTPVYYGHSFNNPKDIPFATMSLVAFAGIISCWRHLPDVPRGVWVRTGLALGLALAIRIGGVLYCGYLALSWAAWLAVRAYPFTSDRMRQALADARRLLVAGVKIAAVAWMVMAVFSPIMQARPFGGLWRTLHAAAHFPDMDGKVRFDGMDLPADQLPWTYAPVWFAITLPEFYVVAAAAGALALWWNTRSLTRLVDPRSTVFIALLMVAAGLPIVSAIALKAVLYDGIRHLLFIVPPLAILAGIAVAGLLDGAGARLAKAAVIVLVAISVATTSADMVRLHPYESIYFNRTVGGGLRAASSRFETDYWGLSYKEGLEWVLAHYRPDTGAPIRVANCGEPFQTGYYLSKTPDRRARYVSVNMDAQPNVVLATTRWSCHTKTPGRVIHVVERMGTALCYVIEVEPPKAARAGG